MTGNATDGGLENYYVAVEHMHFKNLFFDNCIKVLNFHYTVCELDENSGCVDAR
jgi:hypothetical protein